MEEVVMISSSQQAFLKAKDTSYLCYTATQAYLAHASSKLCEAIFSQKVLYLSSFLACLIASGCWRPACCSSQYSLQMALLL